MIKASLIKSKLSDLEKYYVEAAPLLEFTSRTLIDDTLRLRSLERLFQLIVDTALDVNTHIIAEMDIAIPDDYQSTFEVLARQKVIPMSFSLTIAPSVGLRNRVVHKYGEVNLKRMVDEIKQGLPQYLEYAKYIFSYVNKIEQEGSVS